MRKFYLSALSFLFLICLLVNQSYACTTFCLKGKGEVIFGNNYDWMIGDGFVFINKRGVQKVSTTADAKNPVKWVSRYGSVTFNQYGRENPASGINEAGLVIALMWLDETQYPKADGSRPTIDVLEWIQNQLDTAATVEEVLKNTENLVVTSDIKLHYLVNDKAGNSASIEFLNGKLVTHSGEKLAVSTLTNDTYDNSLNYSKKTPLEKAKTDGSLDRFARAAEKTKDFERKPKTEQEAVDYAFDILTDAEEKGYTSTTSLTQWSIVYDQKRDKIYFRTIQSPQIKSFDTKAFDYSCSTPVKIFDMNAKESGDVTAKFTDYTSQANRDLIERSFNGTDFLKDTPAVIRNFLASYPEDFACSSNDQKSDSGQMKDVEKTGTSRNFLLVSPLLHFLENYMTDSK